MKKRVLVVEDDTTLARVLKDNLVFEGLEAECIANGGSALAKAHEFKPDLIILDIGLPDMSGFDLCGPLRQTARSPIIILSAYGQNADKIRGFNAGADDYVTKPFELEELLARVRAVLRRAGAIVTRITLGRVVVDFALQVAMKDDRIVHLTRREFEILQYLAERHGRVVHRDELLRHVWGYPDSPITRSVDHAVARLRKKIEVNPHDPRFIHTVHGDGYCLTNDNS